MKTELRSKFHTFIAVFFLSLMSVNAQTVTCFDATASSAKDFWLSNFYFSKCTDYLNTGGKDITNSSYVDFNGGGKVIFDKVYVSKDADYTCRLTYGIGWADPVSGCDFNLIVNDALLGKYTVYGPHAAGTTIDLPLPLGTLATDWNNIIVIQQARHWPTTLGMQLIKGLTNATPTINEYTFKVTGMNKCIQISNLTGDKNNIDIFTLEGRLMNSEVVSGATFTKFVNQGVYLVKVNGTPVKVVVQ